MTIHLTAWCMTHGKKRKAIINSRNDKHQCIYDWRIYENKCRKAESWNKKDTRTVYSIKEWQQNHAMSGQN